MRWYNKLALYLIFFVFVIYAFAMIYEEISGFRTDMLIEGFISGKIWTLENLFIVFAVSLVLMVFKQFIAASLQTGVYVAMKDDKK